MARRVSVSEIANLPFNLSEEDISRGVASVRRQLEELGLLPESQPTVASNCYGSDVSFAVQSKDINGRIKAKAAINELVSSGVHVTEQMW